jgi:hypothetical protein
MIEYTYGADDNAPTTVEAGTYPATIKKASEKISKSGNKMLEIIWKLDNGLELFDHVVDHPHPLCRKKSDEFLMALGNEAKKGSKVSVDAGDLTGVKANLIVILVDGKNEVKGYEPAVIDEQELKKESEKKSDRLPF